METEGNHHSFLHLRILMKIITWNCYATGCTKFRNHSRSLKEKYNPHVLMIMETRVDNDHAKVIP